MVGGMNGNPLTTIYKDIFHFTFNLKLINDKKCVKNNQQTKNSCVVM